MDMQISPKHEELIDALYEYYHKLYEHMDESKFDIVIYVTNKFMSELKRDQYLNVRGVFNPDIANRFNKPTFHGYEVRVADLPQKYHEKGWRINFELK